MAAGVNIPPPLLITLGILAVLMIVFSVFPLFITLLDKVRTKKKPSQFEITKMISGAESHRVLITEAETIVRKVKYLALRRYREGRYDNPFLESSLSKHSILVAAMYELYERELEKLKQGRLCPCCGQMTLGDVDF